MNTFASGIAIVIFLFGVIDVSKIWHKATNILKFCVNVSRNRQFSWRASYLGTNVYNSPIFCQTNFNFEELWSAKSALKYSGAEAINAQGNHNSSWIQGWEKKCVRACFIISQISTKLYWLIILNCRMKHNLIIFFPRLIIFRNLWATVLTHKLQSREPIVYILILKLLHLQVNIV